MDPNCGAIAAGIDIDCDYLPGGGVEPNILLIKKTEWDLAVTAGTITFDGTSANLIDALVLTTGDQGYYFQGYPMQTKPVITGLKRPSGYRYKQSIDFIIDGSVAANEKILTDMGDGRFVVIYINSFANEGGAGKYKVLGVEAGLKRPEGGAELDKYNDVDGVWIVKFASEDHALESTPEYTFWDTDEATTDAAFVVLQSVAS